jgi:alkylation response protein AidB-like acyl-CoA dehydrogenase
MRNRTVEPAEIEAARRRVRETLTGLVMPRDPLRVRSMGSHIYDVDEARAYLATIAEFGYAAPHWPVEHGGLGASPAVADAIAEELLQFETPNLYPFFVALYPVAAGIIAFGDAAQQARFLPAILRGQDVWTQLFSEPDAGSDLASVRTSAARDGELWRVRGSKIWASRASYARWGYLLARTDSSAPKHAGLTMFAMDMRAPGIENRPMKQMNGAANFSAIFLDDVEIPDRDRIGPVNEGWKVVGASLRAERASATGGPGMSLEQIVRLGSAPAVRDNAVLRDRIAQLVIEFRTVQWTEERARAARRTGREEPSASLRKLQASRLLVNFSRLQLDVAGAASLAWEREPGDVVRDFLTSPAASLRGGTDEIQKNIIAEQDLGLPREPRRP